MSAERQVFKQIDQLIQERDAYLRNYKSTGQELVFLAIKEFMAEHQDVKNLFWQQSPYLLGAFRVEMEEYRLYTAHDLRERDPQLSKCIEAMEQKFAGILDVLHEMFGTSKSVQFSQEQSAAL